MYKLERLLVALDLTKMDDILIKYVSHLAEFLKSDKVYFVHISRNLELPEELRRNYPDLMAPSDESITDSIQKVISTAWETDYDCEKVIEIKEGDPSEQILKWVNIKDIDMMVMGRKKELKGGGIVPQKIAKVAQTSLMLVPEDFVFKLNKIVVSVDFSKHAKLAVEEALAISNEKNISLSLVNVFKVPSGYHKTGKNYDEFALIMKGHGKTDFREFVKKNNFPEDLDCQFVLDNDDSPADKIFDFASDQKADMIVMGSKGRTGLASILLGSVAEKVVKYDNEIPLMIVKEKGENMGFLKALLKL
ncbi:universal stress protein [uncultured Marivirga sp.]|uniref:universal stress protein n=1 Tax=uncultured Marivirga sp. TaxID=1123707 RepID=UPI0030ED6C5A|tara:strand:- start:206372 stop:207286 length:915 start_codon:yes stop_codon:yes gene_type:complete